MSLFYNEEGKRVVTTFIQLSGGLVIFVVKVPRTKGSIMYRRPLLVSTILVAAGAIASALADSPVKFRDLPRPVQKAIEKQANGSPIGGISKEIRRGKTIYEAEFEVNGHNGALSVDDTGAVVEVENQLEMDDLPGHARFALQKVKHMANLLRLVYQTALQQDPGRSER